MDELDELDEEFDGEYDLVVTEEFDELVLVGVLTILVDSEEER